MNKLISTENSIFPCLVGPCDFGKKYLIHEWLKVGTFQTKFDKICFFYQHPQPLYDVMKKEIDNLEFLQGVHFENINFLKNNGTKYLLILMTDVQNFATLRSLWTFLLLADIAKNVPVPDIYLTLLDAASITPDIVVISHALERGAWIPFKIWTTKVAETFHARICSICFCAQFDKSRETLSVKGQRIFTFKNFIY